MQSSNTWRTRYLPGVALVVLVLAIYGQTAQFDFIAYDDPEMVANNRHVQDAFSASSIVWAFTTFSSGNWYPFTWLSHMLDWRLFGDWAGGHHLMNAAYHAASAVMLYLVLLGMTGSRGRSWMVAALFAVHPLAVESATWISERKNTLSTLFWFATMFAYLAYVKRGGAWRYTRVALLFTAGLMCKPMLVTLPCVLLLLDYWPLRRPQRFKQLAIEKLPLLAISIAFSIVTIVAQHSQEAVRDLEQFTFAARLGNCVMAHLVYIRHLFWPLHLSPMYPNPELAVWQPIVGGAVLIAIFAALVIAARRRDRRYLIVGWLWYLGVLFPVNGLIQVGAYAVTDRYVHVPIIGLYILLVWSVTHRTAKVAATVCIIALSTASFVQVTYWRDSLTLFTRAIAVTQNNSTAHYLVGSELLARGQLEPAAEHFAIAIDTGMHNGKARNALGVVRRRQGRIDQAVELWQAAKSIAPQLAAPHTNLGDHHYSQGRAAPAIEYYLAALSLGDPDLTDDDISRIADSAAWLLATQDLPEYPPQLALQIAGDNLKRADPNDPRKLATFAAALAHNGRFEQALTTIEHAASLARQQHDTQALGRFGLYAQHFRERKPLRFRIAPDNVP